MGYFRAAADGQSRNIGTASYNLLWGNIQTYWNVVVANCGTFFMRDYSNAATFVVSCTFTCTIMTAKLAHAPDPNHHDSTNCPERL